MPQRGRHGAVRQLCPVWVWRRGPGLDQVARLHLVQADPSLPKGQGGGQGAAESLLGAQSCFVPCRKNMQRNKQVAMGRKKFNMDPKKVL